MSLDVRVLPRDRFADLAGPITTAFGNVLSPERIERWKGIPELDVLLGACEGDAVVGAAGAFAFDLTVPGGVTVATSGVTLVGVLPTHRRRGVLRQLMRRHLDDAHRRGQPAAALFASESSIYGRFGYGMASLRGDVELPAHHTAFARPGADGGATHRVRLLAEAEATRTFPVIWDRERLVRPGMLSRSETWWRSRRTSDPDWARAGRPPLQRALLEIDGRPAAYALYRLESSFGPRNHDLRLEVLEALGDTPEATRAIWRYVLDLDIVTSFLAAGLPLDHPLLFLLAEPGRLHMTLSEGLWIRLVDVAAALGGRGYAPAADGGSLVLEVDDAFCPWNSGRYRLAGGVVDRTLAAPDVSLDVEALGSVYLGGVAFGQLAQAGRVTERTPGALMRADALFRGDRAPWCPEVF